MDPLTVEEMREMRGLFIRERQRIFEETCVTAERLEQVVEDLRVEMAVRHGLAAQVLAEIRQRRGR